MPGEGTLTFPSKPIFQCADSDVKGADSIIFASDRPTTRHELLCAAHPVGAAVKKLGSHVINLCEDRERFAEALIGAAMAGVTTLLPQDRHPRTIGQLQACWPGAMPIDDDVVQGIPRPSSCLHVEFNPPPEFEAIILFTSGSTGAPQPHPKRWVDLMTGASSLAGRLGLLDEAFRGARMVATVPSQHMFGLETSVLLPLHGHLSVFTGRPFYPADVADALKAAPAPRVLVTSPLHLRALVEADIEWPSLRLILSATDVLPEELAVRAEQVLRAPVVELYGSTETGAIATRRTVMGQPWHLLDGVTLQEEGGDAWVEAPHVSRVALNDHVRRVDNAHFMLLGRKGDLIKVAGKRGSLGDMNQKLRSIPGVFDGVIFMPETGGRPVGLVVAPGLSVRDIQAALSQELDPVFLPRPLYRVAVLPRTEAGKLARQDLIGLLEDIRGET